MDSTFKVAIILSAYDKMTTVFTQATAASSAKLQALQDQAKKTFAKGGVLFGAGLATAAALKPAIDAYAQLEESQNRLKSTMMGAGGFLDEEKFRSISGLAVQLGNELKGNSADFFTMINKQMQLGTSVETILNGVGRSTAYLAIATNQGYEAAAEMSSKLKYATGVADAQMNQFLDTIARTYNLGVKTEDMEMAFARSAGALKTLNLQGLGAAQSLAPLYALLAKAGQNGERIGTNMEAIFNQMMDTKKMGKFNNALQEFGMHAQFVNKKTGQFMGVKNMLKQLDQLKTLNPQQLSNVVAAWLGPGFDASFVKIFTSAGTEGYKAMVHQMNNQATIDQKVAVQNDGFNLRWEALVGTWDNVMAAFGATLMPVLKPLLDMLNNLAGALQVFIEKHPLIFQFISTFAAIASAGLMLAGIIKIIQGITMVVRILNITLLLNPFVLIAAVAIAVVILIMTHWEEISSFFRELWIDVYNGFFSAMNWIKNLFLDYTPQGLIYKHWDGIVNYFSNLWARVKAIFTNAWGSIKTFFGFGDGNIGLDATKNINVLGGGGSAGLKPNPIGSSSINYSPVINYSGPGGAQDATVLTGMMKSNFDKQMQDHHAQKARVAF